MCAQKELALGAGAWAPVGLPNSRVLSKVSHDSRWRGALQRRTQSYLGSTGGVGSEANQKLGKMMWAFLLEAARGNTLA